MNKAPSVGKQELARYSPDMKLFLFLVYLFSQFSWATPQVVLRAHPTHPYRLPAGAAINSSNVQVGPSGAVAIRVQLPDESFQQGIWLDGQIPFKAPKENIVRNLAFTPAGNLLFDLLHLSYRTTGALEWSPKTQSEVFRVVPGDAGVTEARFVTYLQKVHEHYVVRQETHFGGRILTALPSGKALFADNQVDPQSNIRYLFAPSINQHGSIASKVRMGHSLEESAPDQIVLRTQQGQLRVVAEDRDKNPSSPFLRFSNSVSLSDSGWVAFQATTESQQQWLLWKNGSLQTVAQTGSSLKDLDAFPAAIGEDDWLYFRGRDAQERHCVFAARSGQWQPLLCTNDPIDTDLGAARLGQHTPEEPTFGGAISVWGSKLAVTAGLTPIDDPSIEWGTGVLVVDLPTNSKPVPNPGPAVPQ